MKLVAHAAVDAAAWDALVECSPQAWCFHRHAWVAIEAAAGGVDSHAFAIVGADERVVGVLPLYVQSLGLGTFEERLVHCGLHRHTGLALAPDLAREQVAEARALALERVFAVAGATGADRIQLNAQNLAPAHRRAPAGVPFWVSDHGFELGVQSGPAGILPAPGMSTLAADQLIDLAGRSSDELFDAMDSAARRAVRKARKSGVTARCLPAAEALEVFRRLAEKSARRTGETPAPRHYHEGVARLDGPRVRSLVLLAEVDAEPVAALWLLLDKGAAHFLAGVSDPERLELRANDLLHWSALEWSSAAGCDVHRLGPTFPELPPDWPVARLARFKRKFGSRSLPVVQGSFFLRAERYAVLAEGAVRARIAASVERAAARRRVAVDPLPLPEAELSLGSGTLEDLAVILRAYGAVDLPLRAVPSDRPPVAAARAVVAATPDVALPAAVRATRRAPGPCYVDPDGRVAYRPLLPHVTFEGEGLRRLWTGPEGDAVVALHEAPGRRTLLVGLDAVEEMVRRRQGDPRRVDEAADRSAFGFSFERPNYLFEDQVWRERPTIPFADHLGFVLAEELARLTGAALVEPLPGGVRGLVLVTGDDDQAELHRYAAQQRLLRGTPITYYLVPQTRHSARTLSGLRPPVAFGLHVDALDAPEDYDRLCSEQTALLRDLTGAPCRTIRNHGFLNRGYLGHLEAWEANDIRLDLNVPGVDGTALNGSFLPMRVRRADGRWSRHQTLLSAFGDGMLQALSLDEREAVRRVQTVVRQVEESGRPAALVFNLHPQNAPTARRLHRCVRRLARRHGWRACLVEDYLDWLLGLDELRIRHGRDACTVRSPRRMDGLVLRRPEDGGWRRATPGAVQGEREVRFA